MLSHRAQGIILKEHAGRNRVVRVKIFSAWVRE
jgi:hypothetical protein